MKSLFFVFLINLQVCLDSDNWDNIKEEVDSQKKFSELLKQKHKPRKTLEVDLTPSEEFINVTGDEIMHLRDLKKIADQSNFIY